MRINRLGITVESIHDLGMFVLSHIGNDLNCIPVGRQSHGT
jgi:hypothetical protein